MSRATNIQPPKHLIHFNRGFEPDIITALMMEARAAGAMAHWREAMC